MLRDHAHHVLAERALRGGRIYTQDPSCPWAEAIAIAGNRISFAGSNVEVDSLAGPHTETIELNGRFVMPGFNDAHIHLTPRMLPWLIQCGITTAQTIGQVADLPEFVRLANEGALTTRLEVRLPLESWREFPRYRAMVARTGGMVEVTGLKAYADGMLRTRTAFLLEPYSGSAGGRGSLSQAAADTAGFDGMLDGAVSVGADVSTHAIGDAAVRCVLRHYEDLIDRHKLADHRLRIIHASLVSPLDLSRFGESSVIAEVNPYHAMAIPWLKNIVGEARTRWAFAFRSLKANGARLCFGSDYPGPEGRPEFPLYPLLGVQSAVLHENPDERLTLKEALEAYTVGPAHASRNDALKGTVEVGKLADLVVLSENPFEVAANRIGGIRVIQTWMNGKVVFAEPA
jgi:predicted amidohydrolase YtcJ